MTSDDVSGKRDHADRSERKRESQAARPVNLAKASEAKLYHDELDRCYVDMDGNGRIVTRLNNHAARKWVTCLLLETEGVTASAEAVRQALLALEGIALREGDLLSQDLKDAMVATAAILKEAEGNSAKTPAATRLVQLALDSGAELFHDQRKDPHIVLPGTRREIVRIPSQTVRRWLARLQWETDETAPSMEAINAALNVLASKAVFEADQHHLYVRVAWHAGDLWYDLGDGRAVRVTPGHWEVSNLQPIRRACHPPGQSLGVVGEAYQRAVGYRVATGRGAGSMNRLQERAVSWHSMR